MVAGRRTLLVGVVTGMLFASGAAFLAHERDHDNGVIRGCFDSNTGALRLIGPNGSCTKRETLVEWNRTGPQGFRGPDGNRGPQGSNGTRGVPGLVGPMGPAGPAGPAGPMGPAGPAGTGGSPLRVVDGQGREIGAWANPDLVSVQVGTEMVLTWLDLPGKSFLNQPPAYYFTQANCGGTPQMALDLRRLGSVNSGTLFYPTGAGSTQHYLSYSDGFLNPDGTPTCYAVDGWYPLAPVGHTLVTGFVAPFSIAR